jgi:hypothetical protein
MSVDGLAFVTEMCELEDASRYSGLFAARWESDDGTKLRDGPEDVPVDEALAWAREQAPIVIVQVGGGEDGMYSAGTSELLEDGVQPWPVEGLVIAERPEGSALDGSEQSVEAAYVRLRVSEEQEGRICDRLRADPRVAGVEQSDTREFSFALVVCGSGLKPAADLALRLLIDAVSDALPGSSIDDVGLTAAFKRYRAL